MRRLLGITGGLLLAACTHSRQSLSAGEIGCRPSEITISEETVGNDGFAMSSENWVAECNGRRFICTQLDNRNFIHTGADSGPAMVSQTAVSCKEEHSGSSSSTTVAPAPSPAPSSPPPKGGAGFELGAKLEASQAACEGAGYAWQSVDSATATCSGTPAPLGFTATVTLKLCSGLVCGIALFHQPQTNWLEIIAELRNGLESKYGPAREREGELHEGCRDKAAFVACLKSRRARLRYLWSWPSGERVLLLVGIPREGGEAAVRLDYSKPARALIVNESAL